jgi:hypothetical protein
MDMETEAIKVVISYTHDSPAHKHRVLALSERLRSEGVDCVIDQYEDSPPEGWPRWMDNQIDQADFVLVACTEIYLRRFQGKEEPGIGLGAQWEGFVITQELYDSAGRNQKFIPILFSAEDAEHRPKILRSATYYRVDQEDGYEDLYRRLTAQPKIIKAPLGSKRKLEAVNFGNAPAPEIAQKPPETKDQTRHDLTRLTLVFLSDAKFTFVPSHRIEHGEDLVLDLLPDNARTVAFLTDLQDGFYRPEIGVAFRNTALQGHIRKVTRTHQESREHFILQMEPSKDNYSPLSDFSFNDYSPDDIAELRARRILLDEKLDLPRGRGRFDDGMMEHMIARDEGLIKKIASPLPSLFQAHRNDPEYFLEAAKLMSVLYLKLTGTVEHIFRLELDMQGEVEVVVRFEGQRPARYANVDPHVIKFEGTCALT